MKDIVFWMWDGPWWAPFVGALYFAVFISIALGPLIGAIKAGKKE